MKAVYTETDWRGVPRVHDLHFVEYDSRGHPFNVQTAIEEGPRRTCSFDFAWSRTYGRSYFHISGCGGELRNCFGKSVPTPRRKIRFWASPDVKLQRWEEKDCHGHYVPITQKEWEAMGYKRIPKPLGNPFEGDVMEGESVYCRTCDDWFPDETWYMCQHLAWCETCGEVVHVTRHGHIGWDEYRGRRKKHPLES